MASSRYRGTRRELYEVGEERRGRPRRNRVKLFFKMDGAVRQRLDSLSTRYPHLKATQSELAGLGVELLGGRLDEMAAAIGREGAILPAGVVDLESLYLIWNLEFPFKDRGHTTTVYLLPEQAVRLSEIRAKLRLQIHVSQSELLNLGLTLLADLAATAPAGAEQFPIRDIEALSDVFLAFV